MAEVKIIYETIGHNLFVVSKLHLLDSLIINMLIYGCEVWELKISNTQKSFSKMTTGSKRNTQPDGIWGTGKIGTSVSSLVPG